MTDSLGRNSASIVRQTAAFLDEMTGVEIGNRALLRLNGRILDTEKPLSWYFDRWTEFVRFVVSDHRTVDILFATKRPTPNWLAYAMIVVVKAVVGWGPTSREQWQGWVHLQDAEDLVVRMFALACTDGQHFSLEVVQAGIES